MFNVLGIIRLPGCFPCTGLDGSALRWRIFAFSEKASLTATRFTTLLPGPIMKISRDETLPSIEADVVAAAASLAPALRSRAAETDKLAKLPDATISDLESARLFDMMVPKIYGRLQCSIRTMMDAVVQLGQGDGSVAWVVALRAAVTWMPMTSYPKHVSCSQPWAWQRPCSKCLP